MGEVKVISCNCTKYKDLRGFNYQPSYGTTGLELWQKFDADAIDRELGRGKKLFPGMNAIRIWLSWDAFIRDPERFSKNFDTVLRIAAKYEVVVMPVLFNRWHERPLDYGGIYIDHFLPGVSWLQSDKDIFVPYLEAIVGGHATDPRIFAWDICNEPFSYCCKPSEIPEIVKAEYAWLEETYNTCKRLKAQAPITVGIHAMHGLAGIQQVEPLSDILSIHPYRLPSANKANYKNLLDVYVEFANKVNKPLLASEACWGSLDDMERASMIRYALGELKKHRIGWMVYLLHHSLKAGAHRPGYGPIHYGGNLAFIEADGSLRPGHEVFNEF